MHSCQIHQNISASLCEDPSKILGLGILLQNICVVRLKEGHLVCFVTQENKMNDKSQIYYFIQIKIKFTIFVYFTKYNFYKTLNLFTSRKGIRFYTRGFVK